MPSPKARILCTEDDPDSRELIVFVLEGADYDVTCAEVATDALSLAQSKQFDLILVDSWMPGLSGQELTTEIRKFNKSTPILFYSGAAYDADKRAARDAGAQGYLTKPEGITDLVDEVAKLIAEAKIAYPVAVNLPE
jgi:two-component system, sensor histidine kinase and response regulator